MRGTIGRVNRGAALSLIGLTGAVFLGGDVALAAARPGIPPRIITRERDDLGVWHVTAVWPGSGAQHLGGRGAPLSLIARIDCRQRVIRVDGRSGSEAEDDARSGWAPPSDSAQTSLLEAICADRPLPLSARARPAPTAGVLRSALTPPASLPTAPSATSAPAGLSGRAGLSARTFAAQVGVFATRVDALSALQALRSQLPVLASLSSDVDERPDGSLRFRALFLAPGLSQAKAACAAVVGLGGGRGCWVHAAQISGVKPK